MSMRILVTGGAGFQGSHLVESLLGSGHMITILNTYSQQAVDNISPFKDRVSVVWGSVTDQQVVSKSVREHDVVIHLAALIHVDESVHEPRQTPPCR